jgi:parallel beta-helix repeat protein
MNIEGDDDLTAGRREFVRVNEQWYMRRPLEVYNFETTGKDMHGHARGHLVYKGVEPKGLDNIWKGYFAISDRDDSPANIRNRIFIRLKPSVNIKDAKIEVGCTPDKSGPTIGVNGKNNVAIRNFTICYSNNDRGASTISIGQGIIVNQGEPTKNILVENCLFTQNKGHGVWLGNGAEQVTIRKCLFTKSHSGLGAGPNSNSAKMLRVEDCTMTECSVGGKINGVHGVVFLRTSFINNGEFGLATDCGCENLLFKNCIFYGNGAQGLFLEMSPDPSIVNCIFANNGNNGIRAWNSANTRIIGSVIVGNSTGFTVSNIGQIRIVSSHRGWGTEDLKTTEIRNCVVAGNRTGPLLVIGEGQIFCPWAGATAAATADKIAEANSKPISKNDPFIGLKMSGNQYFREDLQNGVFFDHSYKLPLNLEGWQQTIAARSKLGKQDTGVIGKDPGILPDGSADFSPGSTLCQLAAKMGTPLPMDLIKKCPSRSTEAKVATTKEKGGDQ